MRFLDLCARKPKGWQAEARKVYAEASAESKQHINEAGESFIVGNDEDSWPLE